MVSFVGWVGSGCEEEGRSEGRESGKRAGSSMEVSGEGKRSKCGRR